MRLFFSIVLLATLFLLPGCDENEQIVAPTSNSHHSIDAKANPDTVSACLHSTFIEFLLPVQSTVSLKIYSAEGPQVAFLLDNVYFEAGVYGVYLNLDSWASGVYYYHLLAVDESGEKYETLKKMVLLK